MARPWPANSSRVLLPLLLAAGCTGAIPERPAPPAPSPAAADAATPPAPVPALDAAAPPDLAADAEERAPDAEIAPDAAPDLGPLPPGAAGPWATGVKVALLEAAQAVFIKIGDDGGEVPPAMRNSTLIEGRATFLRLHLRTDAGFTARPLRAVLTLEYADGSKQTFEDGKIISGTSAPEKLDSTFNFLIPADAVKPESKVVAAVYEAAGLPAPEPPAPPRFPASGAADLGVKGGPMIMEVVLVPVRGPSGPLDDSPARRKHLESYLADVYPVQTMTIRWHAPLTTTSIITSDTAFGMLANQRRQDGASPGAYYHMLIAVEDSVDKFLGLGMTAGPVPTEAARRIAMTMVTDHQVDSQMDTVSHEMGHNLGRAHAPGCNAAGVDARFPYPNTGVGVDGYSIPEKAFKSKGKFKDVMGYCYPTWISDYTWNAFAARTRIVSEFTSPPSSTTMVAAGRSLQGFHSPGHPPRWTVVDGHLVADGPPSSAARRARILGADGSETVGAVSVQPLLGPSGPVAVRELAVALPDEAVARVEVDVDGERFVLTADEVEGL
jgi:hypothetical protein